jgi:SAM-dependent methyltransferase
MLYKDLTHVYDELYQILFDYDKEHRFYSEMLEKFQVKSVLELGCGTGHLAKRFTEGGYQYCGIDLSEDMLVLARKRNPNSVFIKKNMARFKIPFSTEGVLITGRSLSYLIKNQDIISCFKSIYNALTNGGILIFDAIEAGDLFSSSKVYSDTEIIKSFNNNTYKRISNTKPNLKTGWTWDWSSIYFKDDNTGFTEIGNDFATLRAFTLDEMRLFLKITGFEILDIIKKETYAWQDYYFVAKKI